MALLRYPLALVLLLAFSSSTPSMEMNEAPVDTVYICLSPNAKKYHLRKDCQALKRCESEVKAVSLQEAGRRYGRTLCGHEK